LYIKVSYCGDYIVTTLSAMREFTGNNIREKRVIYISIHESVTAVQYKKTKHADQLRQLEKQETTVLKSEEVKKLHLFRLFEDTRRNSEAVGVTIVSRFGTIRRDFLTKSAASLSSINC